jgi:hypothetical protein
MPQEATMKAGAGFAGAVLAIAVITIGSCDNLPPEPLNADAWTITTVEDLGQSVCAATLTEGSIITYGNPPVPDQPPGSDWLTNGSSPGGLFKPSNNYVCKITTVTAIRNNLVLSDYTWKKGNVVTLAVTYPHLGKPPGEDKIQSLAYKVALDSDAQETIVFNKVIVLSGEFPAIASVAGPVNFGRWPAKAGGATLQRTGYTAARDCSIANNTLSCPQ